MSDEIIEELWKVKDNIAREHDNDVRKIATYLQGRKRFERSYGASEFLDNPENERPSLGGAR